jgi:hypothetical protein
MQRRRRQADDPSVGKEELLYWPGVAWMPKVGTVEAEFGAMEAGYAPEFVAYPEEFLGGVKGDAGSRGEGFIHV